MVASGVQRNSFGSQPLATIVCAEMPQSLVRVLICTVSDFLQHEREDSKGAAVGRTRAAVAARPFWTR